MKELVYQKITEILDQRIESAQEAIDLAEDSKNNDTKSSAGDKYETGRAMMQRQKDMFEIQLINSQNLKGVLSQIDIHQKFDTVALGSLVSTTRGVYFISVGIGKVKIGNETIYAISLDSPIGQLLHKRKQGDEIVFQEHTFSILEIK